MTKTSANLCEEAKAEIADIVRNIVSPLYKSIKK